MASMCTHPYMAAHLSCPTGSSSLRRGLTSFVLPVHNQGASLAIHQGHALWRKFLPATSSFFVLSLLIKHSDYSTFRRTLAISSVTDISVKADVKSVLGNTSAENLQKCKVQGKYIGTITDIHKGTVFIRLNIGVNAIAHSCYGSRLPGKKDEVSFVVTRIDSERNVAVGLISRIVKQNI